LGLGKYSKQQFYTFMRSELGVVILGNEWGAFYITWFDTAELRDWLDGVTVAYRVLSTHPDDAKSAKRWLAVVNRIFHDEALGYSANEHGAVRHLVDEEFERNGPRPSRNGR
jgi:hypothetical protein